MTSTEYYRTHPAARKRKAKRDAEINRRPEQVKKRTALNRYNRRKGKYGNGDGLDASHKDGKITGYVKASRNRGYKNHSQGDRNARG